MTTYQWAGSHAYRDHANDREIMPGEELPEDVAEDIASAHPHDVEAVDEDDSGGAEEDDDAVKPAEEPPFDPTEKTVSEIESELEDNEFTEAELLAVYSAEREAEDRTTAVETIDERLDDLEA